MPVPEACGGTGWVFVYPAGRAKALQMSSATRPVSPGRPQKCQCGCCCCGSLIRAVEWPPRRNLCAALFSGSAYGAHKSAASGHLIIVIIPIMPSIPSISPSISPSILIIVSIRSGNLVANWDANLVPALSLLLSPSLSLSCCVRIFVAQFATQIINSKWKL